MALDVGGPKMTVYGVGDDPPFVRSLVGTAEAGKQVACVIELTARLDEARNLHWARQLESAGAHVTYGILGLKTHTKIALVVQQRGTGLRCYAHIGTGNYPVKTAGLYADVGLLTQIVRSPPTSSTAFTASRGRSRGRASRKLLVAPMNMRQRLLEMIEREAAHCEAGRERRIIAKVNQVDDVEIVLGANRSDRPRLLLSAFGCRRLERQRSRALDHRAPDGAKDDADVR